MTNEEAEALGRRALAAGFKERDDAVESGILWSTGGMFCRESDPAGLAQAGWWPDFRDWATLGVLVGQVRERWGDPRLYARPCNMGMWSVRAGRDPWIRSTEAGAWVAALEAAP